MDLETVLKALEPLRLPAASAADRAIRRGTSSRYSAHRRRSHLGLARRGPSRLAALHRRERHAGRLVAVVLRSNPAEVREGPKKGLRILGAEEDAARALLTALDASQRTTAIVEATRPAIW